MKSSIATPSLKREGNGNQGELKVTLIYSLSFMKLV